MYKDSTTNAKIIDNNTVNGSIDGMQKSIKVLDGGLPEGTYKVVIKKTSNNLPETQVVLGAYIKGRTNPLTCIGEII